MTKSKQLSSSEARLQIIREQAAINLWNRPANVTQKEWDSAIRYNQQQLIRELKVAFKKIGELLKKYNILSDEDKRLVAKIVRDSIPEELWLMMKEVKVAPLSTVEISHARWSTLMAEARRNRAAS